MDLRKIKAEIESLQPHRYKIIPCPEDAVSHIFSKTEFEAARKKYVKAIKPGEEVYAVLYGHYKKNNSGRLTIADFSEYFINDGTTEEEEEEEDFISYPQEIAKPEPIKQAIPQVKEPEKVEEKPIQREPTEREISEINSRIFKDFGW